VRKKDLVSTSLKGGSDVKNIYEIRLLSHRRRRAYWWI